MDIQRIILMRSGLRVCERSLNTVLDINQKDIESIGIIGEGVRVTFIDREGEPRKCLIPMHAIMAVEYVKENVAKPKPTNPPKPAAKKAPLKKRNKLVL